MRVKLIVFSFILFLLGILTRQRAVTKQTALGISET